MKSIIIFFVFYTFFLSNNIAQQSKKLKGFVKNNEVDHISFDIHLDKYNTLALSKWFYTDRKFRGLHLLHRTVIGKEYSLPPNIDTENMYLHQLQNLYFALTNQELNIQL